MANYSSVQSGNWSDPATWGGGGWPNQNGDTATINAAHTVVFDADLSGLSSGLGNVTVNGKLKFASHTKIKIAGFFLGNGVFRCGEEGAEVEDVWIYFNGNYCNQIVDVQYWGKDRVGEITGYLTQDYNVGATQLQLDRDVDMRPGDVICISASTIQGPTKDSNPWGKGMYEITNYDAATRTITISPALKSHNRKEGDFVGVLTREIRIFQLATTDYRYNHEKSSQVYKNCWFNKWNSGVIGGDNHIIISCAGSNNAYGGIIYAGKNDRLSGNITSANNVFGGICNQGYGHYLDGNFVCFNNSHSGVSYSSDNIELLGNFVSFNNTAGGVVCNGTNNRLMGNFTCCNNIDSGVCNAGENHCLGGNFICINNNNGGISYSGLNFILSGNFTCSKNGYADFCYRGRNHHLTGNFTSTESTQLCYGYYYISGSFDKKAILYRWGKVRLPWFQTIWLNYDGERLHRVFCYAGQMHTLSDLTGIKFIMEDATEYMIYDIPFYAQKQTFSFSQRVSKNKSMSYLPRIQLIDPNADPLKTVNGQPIDEAIMTDSINTVEMLKISVDNLTVGKRYLVRLIAKDNSGEITWLDRDIAEVSIIPPAEVMKIERRKFDPIEG